MNRLLGFGLVLALLMATGCISNNNVNLVVKPTPKEELSTTVEFFTGVVPVLTNYNQAVATLSLFGGEVCWDGKWSNLSFWPSEWYNRKTYLHLRPGPQVLELIGVITGFSFSHYYEFKLNNHLLFTLSEHDFQPGRYRITGQARDVEFLEEQQKIKFKCDLWLERELSDGIFERVKKFAVKELVDKQT